MTRAAGAGLLQISCTCEFAIKFATNFKELSEDLKSYAAGLHEREPVERIFVGDVLGDIMCNPGIPHFAGCFGMRMNHAMLISACAAHNLIASFQQAPPADELRRQVHLGGSRN